MSVIQTGKRKEAVARNDLVGKKRKGSGRNGKEGTERKKGKWKGATTVVVAGNGSMALSFTDLS
jgi:hypothetical protein